MNETAAQPSRNGVALPEVSALAVGPGGACLLSADGEVALMSHAQAVRQLALAPVMVCHAPATARKIGLDALAAFDVLELYAFVRPARFCLPTVRGLAAALGLAAPDGLEDAALSLFEAARALLGQMAGWDEKARQGAAAVATSMARGGWPWGPAVLRALGPASGRAGIAVWESLPEWEDRPAEPGPAEHGVGADEARARLAELLGAEAETRTAQAEYAGGAAAAFRPREAVGSPNLVLAEAGTGIGKTLGYIAPASLWAEKNAGPVWLSTYTKNLQRQIDRELNRLFPEAAEKAAKVVLRKGRENYFCLLNFAEATGRAAGGPAMVALGLLARWALATRDGDMVGGDFPSWLAGILGESRTLGLADRRGECLYSGCDHYRKCFVERATRASRRAEIVIANHALVMTRHAGFSTEEDADEGLDLPTHYVFDEGHHLFDAADGAFSAVLGGVETAELRRWLRGGEGGGRGRRQSRGLERRVGDLAAGHAGAEAALKAVLAAAAVLPGEGWLGRLAGGRPVGAVEAFLAGVRVLVRARNDPEATPYSLEAAKAELPDDLLAAAAQCEAALAALAKPMAALAKALNKRLDDGASELDSATRGRLAAARRGLLRRLEFSVAVWRAMLNELSLETPGAFVDWFSLERGGGREFDVALRRHYLDPTKPFAESVLQRAHGVLVTSATLRDRAPDAPDDWLSAEVRTGAHHLPLSGARLAKASPFDYPGQTRVLVVTDVARNDPGEVAAAYRELFKAAGGGGLGLFTSIARLKAVHRRIAGDLDAAGLPLYAQHLDAMDTGTLVDIFRVERESCLLGTDAVRDGIDVPGSALRLIVFDRVPWPRPDLLHRARRAAFGGRGYDDMLTRLRLKQAFGRLLRRRDDHGVFVMLDAMMPSRLATAFPEGVEVRRLGLAEAVDEVASFLGRLGAD